MHDLSNPLKSIIPYEKRKTAQKGKRMKARAVTAPGEYGGGKVSEWGKLG
jgi:hypothetical protein